MMIKKTQNYQYFALVWSIFYVNLHIDKYIILYINLIIDIIKPKCKYRYGF